MLGTTLGVKEGNQVTTNSLTAFGEPLSTLPMEDSFFTGKPHVGEMGYVFLFRAYRADQGKWQTSDPLGYPDGWNNFAYVNNMASCSIDFAGAWNLLKWLYTGDGNASDAIYNAAVEEAGASYYDGLQAAIAGMPVLGTALNYYGQTCSWVGWDGSTALAQAVSSDPLVKLFADSFKTNLQRTIEFNKKAGTLSEDSGLLTLDTGTTFDLGSALILGRFYVNVTATWTISHVENNKYRYNGTINYTINDKFDFDLKVRTLSLGLLEFGKPFDVTVSWTDIISGYFYE